MLKILKYLGITLGAVLALILVLVTTVWFFPHAILTDARIKKLVHENGASYFSELPKNIDLKISSLGLNGKHLHLALDRFCLKDPVEGCFQEFRIDLGFKIVGFIKIKLVELGPIRVINESLTLIEQKKSEPEQPASESDSGIFDHLVLPKELKISQILLEFPKIIVPGKTETITADFHLAGASTESLNLKANANSTEGLQASANIQTSFVGGTESPFHADLNVKQDFVIAANLDGKIVWEDFKVNLEGQVAFTKLIPWVHTLELRNLKVTRDQVVKIGSDIFMRIEPKFDFTARDSAMPKASFSTDLEGRFDVEQNKENYDYRIKLGPLTQKGIYLASALNGTFPFPKGEEYRYGLKGLYAEIGIPGFQVFVQHLKKTNSAIPAPFSSMNGTLSLRVGDKSEKIIQDTVPVSFLTDLSGEEQAIITDSSGKIEFLKGLKNIKISGNTDLKKIRLTLPNIDPLTPQPSLTFDSRIKSLKIEKKKKEKKIEVAEAKKKNPESSTVIDWKIVNSGPIHIHYPLLKPYAPIKFNWTIAEHNTGQIDILPMNLEYMKRTAHVKYFNYAVRPGNPPYTYRGSLVIPKTEYTITIDIFDNAGKPEVQLASEPPLEESDIISVLLFNQTSDQLTADESSSVGNTQAAIANRALGLFSIWALSSTPIEAVSYNPATKVYAARVKLANGLTATVGTDWEKTQEVALRKRLGKNFVLSTIFEQDTETDEETTKTLLEWFRRF